MGGDGWLGKGPDVRGACSLPQAAQKFESKLKESVLEADGQLAFRKLADVTAETLMPKIETKGEFGQARWRLTSAPQIPNLLSLDPTTDPFKSLANLSFGAEVEIQIGKKLQVSVMTSITSIRAQTGSGCDKFVLNFRHHLGSNFTHFWRTQKNTRNPKKAQKSLKSPKKPQKLMRSAFWVQASVVRQLRESEMATQWTLLYQLNSKLRLLYSCIPSVTNRLFFEYSAADQN